MVPAGAASATLKSPARGRREPGSKEMNPRRVPPHAGERVCFAHAETGRQLGQANQTGRVAARERRPPPWAYIKQALSLHLRWLGHLDDWINHITSIVVTKKTHNIHPYIYMHISIREKV
jgi:hypothetical protein